MLGAGLDYAAVADRLGIPAGQAYLIATGRSADGSDSVTGREQGLLPSSQDMANPPHENPAGSESVQQWIRARVAADAPMRKAAEQRTAEPSDDESEDISTDVLMVLTREHNKVRVLLKQLSAIPGHKKGGTAEDESERKSIVDMITVRLSRHEAAEEELFWPAVRKALPDGDQWADGAQEQEQEGKETLTALGELAPDTDEFDSLVEQLEAQCREHVAYEYQVFLRLREAMPDDEREELGQEIVAAQKRAPTRPAGDRAAQWKGNPSPESQEQQ